MMNSRKLRRALLMAILAIPAAAQGPVQPGIPAAPPPRAPVQPGIPAAQPAQPPVQPGQVPAQPAQAPAPPAQAPAQPTQVPAQPVQTPAQPVQSPGQLVQTPGLPSAASILDRYVEVTGGAQAYEKRTTEVTRGSIEVPAQGLKGTITRYSSAGGNYFASLEMPGLGAIEMGVTDGVAWENSLVLGPRIKSGVERAEAIREATLNSSLLWRDLYPTVETIGSDAVNGEECFQVKMTPAEGSPQVMCFSKATGLGLKIATTTASQMGDVPVEVLVGGYRDFGGIRAASKITQRAAGQEMVITIESIEVNAAIPEKQFEMPAAVQVLQARQRKQAK